MKRSATVAALTAALLVSGTAQAVTPGQEAYGAPGWALLDEGVNTTSLAPVTYTVKWDSVAARTKLKGYFTQTVGYANGWIDETDFFVSDEVVPATIPGCQPDNTIIVTLEYQPLGKPGVSFGGNCHRVADHTLQSGIIRIDEEWWYPNWFSTSPAVSGWYIRNGITHEFGHAIGLGHPNQDYNLNGTVEDHECVLNPDGTRPVMCAPNGGWMKSYENGKFTPVDVLGLKALVANYQHR